MRTPIDQTLGLVEAAIGLVLAVAAPTPPWPQVLSTVPARVASVQLGRESCVSPWALMAASLVGMLLAWMASIVAVTSDLAGIDS